MTSLPDVYCCLCGAPVPNITLSSPTWMTRFRAVCVLDETWSAAFLSGVGERRQFEEVVPNPCRKAGDRGQSDPVSSAADEVEDEDAEFMEIDLESTAFGQNLAVGPGQRIWGLPFHCACWRLFEAARATERLSDVEVQALFDVLRSFPCHNLVDFGHDYGGVAFYDLDVNIFNRAYSAPTLGRFLPGEEPRLVYDRRADSLILRTQQQNPMDIDDISLVFESVDPFHPPSDITEQVHALTNDTPGNQSLPNRKHGTIQLMNSPGGSMFPQTSAPGGTDVFRKLPVEIRVAIMCELSSRDIVSLKQSSRVFLHTPLPDIFWRSRFGPDKELAHIFEFRQHFHNRGGQWKRIFDHLKSMSRCPSLVNRQRVWTCAQTMHTLLSTRLENRQCYGAPVSSYFEPAVPRTEDDGLWLEAKRCLRSFKDSFHTGSRALFIRAITVPQDDLDGIYVSQVDIIGVAYVCGLRFQLSKGPSLELGYVRRERETLCTWGSGSKARQIVGFNLAQGQRGIRGLAAISSENEVSQWIGGCHNVPRRRLVLPECATGASTGLNMLRCGFDALKMVSLAIRSEAPCQNPPPRSLRETELWYPEIPESHLSFIGINERNPGIYEHGYHQRPLSTLLFRASDSDQSRRVARITVFSQRHAVMGIEFQFDTPLPSSQSTLLGRDTLSRPPDWWRWERPPISRLQRTEVTIDSIGGEEIVAIDVLESNYVKGFKIFTSRGRDFQFPAAAEDAELIESLADNYEGNIMSLKVNSAQVVVGFYAVVSSEGLLNLGLVTATRPQPSLSLLS